MKEIDIPVILVKHVAEEKQIDMVYYIGLNLLLTWAVLTFYENYWACDLVIGSTYVAHSCVFRCFCLLMTGMVTLGVLLTWKERTAENAVINNVLPFEIASLVHMMQYKSVITTVYIALLGIVMIGLAVLFIIGLIKTKRRKGRIINSILRIRDVLFFALIIAIPLSRILLKVMPAPAAPPVFNGEPNFVRAEVADAVRWFVQGV